MRTNTSARASTRKRNIFLLLVLVFILILPVSPADLETALFSSPVHSARSCFFLFACAYLTCLYLVLVFSKDADLLFLIVIIQQSSSFVFVWLCIVLRCWLLLSLLFG